MSEQQIAPAWRHHVLDAGISAGDDWVTIAPENLRETMAALRDGGYRAWGFMTCVDHLATPLVPAPSQRFELVYQVRNLETGHDLRVRAFVPESEPKVESLHDIFAAANWDERETWDLYGIEFTGHPDLARILLPDDWVGHPLRRDYPVGGEPVDFTSDHEAWQTAPAEA